jgi:rRNA processing protein Gar1
MCYGQRWGRSCTPSKGKCFARPPTLQKSAGFAFPLPPTNDKRKVPYFNAPIYLENKSSIGKVDEILGPINEVYFTIKPSDGIVANSFKSGDKVYIGGDKLLPLDRFIPKPKILGPARASASGGLEWVLRCFCSTEEEVGAGSGCRRSRDGQRARCVLPLLHKNLRRLILYAGAPRGAFRGYYFFFAIHWASSDFFVVHREVVVAIEGGLSLFFCS